MDMKGNFNTNNLSYCLLTAQLAEPPDGQTLTVHLKKTLLLLKNLKAFIVAVAVPELDAKLEISSVEEEHLKK